MTRAPASETALAQSQDDRLVELTSSIKCIIPSPQWYKDLWLDLNAEDNALGRSLMSHYMGCSGRTYKLSESEFRSLPITMADTNSTSTNFSRDGISRAIANRSFHEGDKIFDVDESIFVRTNYGNTLGNFQLHLRGKIFWRKNTEGQVVPHFEGKARLNDRYDFDPSTSGIKNSWRGSDTELRVRIAHVGLPGRAFAIESEWMNLGFDFPRDELKPIQQSPNTYKSGYSAYGQQVQLILMRELRSSRWEKASTLERLGILVQTMRRLQETTFGRK